MKKIDDLKKTLNELSSSQSPAETALKCREILTEAVSYIYELTGDYKSEKASLLELIDSDTIINYLDNTDIFDSLHYIRILGMLAKHEDKVRKSEAKHAIQCLSTLIDFVDKKESDDIDSYQPLPYMSEYETRKLYIDLYLKEAGWEVLETKGVEIAEKAGIEIQVDGMPNQQGIGFCDYVLYGRDGKPLAIVEAKKTSVSPDKGRHQVELYGECMRTKYGYTPVLYYTNGYEIKILDGIYPSRKVMAFHTMSELELLIQHRGRKDISDTKVNPKITDRPYQQMAITNICERFNNKHRRGLLVMATGTGKTRTAISIVDILNRNGWVKNVLFLADRTALVNQAKKNFEKLLPDLSVCELSAEKDPDYNARLMFSTYQTMINYIDAEDKKFKSGRFDLIIIDEAHRSIFNKFSAIFHYFDSLLIGLTATPRNEVDTNTYRIFGCEPGTPNFDYSLEEAVREHYLVYYKNVNRTTRLIEAGIHYNELSPEEQAQLDEYLVYEELQNVDTISSNKLFRVLYNKDTCRVVLEDLMTKGIRTDSGEKIGKSVIFAYNHKHAEMIVEMFGEMYPEYGAEYCMLIDNSVNYANDLILKFETDDNFRIAVSVDMLDTGVDVPEILNLVFFKPVKSKIKFAQMIGRGTRLCKDIFGPGQDKKEFLILDYCDNFRYFDMHPEGSDGYNTLSLSQRLFSINLDVLFELQRIEYQEDAYSKSVYDRLKDKLHKEVVTIKGHSERIMVRAEMPFVDKYYDLQSWQSLSAVNVKEIQIHIMPLVSSGVNGEELAVAFDIHMLNIILTLLVSGDIAKSSGHIKTVRKTAQFLLDEKASVPQVFEKADELRTITSDAFWRAPSFNMLEQLRVDLRELMKFIDRNSRGKFDIDIADVTKASDFVGGQNIDIRSYREKVIDYLAENSDSKAIKKIKNLEKIDEEDLKELERVLWEELGTKQDYENATDIENLAAFVRSLVGIDQEAINQKFGEYLNGNEFNSMQQEFVKTIIDYVRQNGDIERADLVNSEPFDNVNLLELFDEKVSKVTGIVDQIHDSIIVA